MRLIAVLLAGLYTASLFAADDPVPNVPEPTVPSIVKSVTIVGGHPDVRLVTHAGDPLDPANLSHDVKSLWNTGQFLDIRVKTTEEPGGAAVEFDVTETPHLFLHDLRLEPNSYGMQPTLPAGTPIDPFRAQQVAGQIRRKLMDKGYISASVEPELVPLGKDKADLLMHVKAGDSVKVEDVRIEGDTVFDPKEVQKALQNLRIRRVLPGFPGLWQGWISHPAYSEQAVQSDLARIQSYYVARGYFDARVSLEESDVKGDNAHIRMFVNAGQHYQVKQIEVSGNGIKTSVTLPRNGLFVPTELCSCLMRVRREAEIKGVVDFNARMSFHTVDNGPGHDPIADLSAVTDEGKPYRVGRIEFSGLQHYSESTVRRNFVLDEGDVLDETRLRQSIARLNQAKLFDSIDESEVAVTTDEATGEANISIPLHEKRRGMWNFSGPVGPVSFAGPLQFMLATHLPNWGPAALELSTYFISFNALGYAHALSKVLPLTLTHQGILPVFSIFRPYTPGEGWKSGIMVAPQLGWQFTAFSYATSQITGRLVPVIMGNNRYISPLAVTFERPGGDAVLLCDPPKPRFHTIRTGLAMALQLLGSTGM